MPKNMLCPQCKGRGIIPVGPTARDLVTEDVVEEAMQALFATAGRLVGATNGDWPPEADEVSRRQIKSWLMLYAEYNVPGIVRED